MISNNRPVLIIDKTKVAREVGTEIRIIVTEEDKEKKIEASKRVMFLATKYLKHKIKGKEGIKIKERALAKVVEENDYFIIAEVLDK